MCVFWFQNFNFNAKDNELQNNSIYDETFISCKFYKLY